MIVCTKSNFIYDITTIIQEIVDVSTNRIKIYNLLTTIKFGHDCLA